MMDALKGGNTYGKCCSQDMEKQSIIDASGSGFQDEYGLKRLFKREANMSIDGMPHLCTRVWNAVSESIHSAWSWKFLEAVSADVLDMPGVWAAEIIRLCERQNSQMSRAKEWQARDLCPPSLLR